MREIYAATEELREQLTHDQQLLIEQWVSFYKKVSPERVEEIKKEVKMNFIGTTITEHLQYEAKEKGKLEGKIESLEILFDEGIISRKEFDKRVKPLQKKLKKFLTQVDLLILKPEKEIPLAAADSKPVQRKAKKSSKRRSKTQQKEVA